MPDQISMARSEIILSPVSSNSLDVSINGNIFSVHKTVLSKYSETLKTMFLSNFSENSKSTIELKETCLEAWKLIFDYMYSSKIALDINSVGVIASIADQYIMKEIQQECSNFLTHYALNYDEHGLSVTRLITAFQISFESHVDDAFSTLLPACIKQISRIFESDAFLLMDILLVKCMCQNEFINVPEIIVVNAIFKWINFDLLLRKKYFQELMQVTQFTALSKNEFYAIRDRAIRLMPDDTHFIDEVGLFFGMRRRLFLTYPRSLWNTPHRKYHYVHSDQIMIIRKQGSMIVILFCSFLQYFLVMTINLLCIGLSYYGLIYDTFSNIITWSNMGVDQKSVLLQFKNESCITYHRSSTLTEIVQLFRYEYTICK